MSESISPPLSPTSSNEKELTECLRDPAALDDASLHVACARAQRAIEKWQNEYIDIEKEIHKRDPSYKVSNPRKAKAVAKSTKAQKGNTQKALKKANAEEKAAAAAINRVAKNPRKNAKGKDKDPELYPEEPPTAPKASGNGKGVDPEAHPNYSATKPKPKYQRNDLSIDMNMTPAATGKRVRKPRKVFQGGDEPTLLMENLTPPPPRRSVKRARTPEELSDGEVTDRPIARKKQRVSAAAPEKEKSKRVASREYSPPAWVRLTNEPAKKRAATPKAAPKKRAATTKPAANQSGSRAPSVVIKRERSPTDDLYGASPKPELEKRRAERAKAANEGDAGPSTGPKKRTAAKAAPAKTGVDPEKSAKMREVWAKRKAEGRSGRHGGPPKESTVKKQSAKKGGK